MLSKKFLIAASLLILSRIAVADATNDHILDQATQKQYLSYLYEAAEIANRVQLEVDTSYMISKTPVSEMCTSFMDEQQFLGDNGIAIYKLVSGHAKDYANLIKGGEINKYCPRYSKMNIKQKGLVWVILLTMVAHFESSCNMKAHAKGPNGTAQGFYQLHKGKEQDYTDHSGACGKNSSLNPNQSSACALAMLDDQLQKTGGVLFSPKSYWDVLRPRGKAKKAGQIAKTLSRSALCNPTML